MSSADDVIDRLTQPGTDFDALPDFIAVHGKYFVCKAQNCSAEDVGDDHFRLTHLPQQFNSFVAIDSAESTSAVFAVRLLNQLHNTMLNGSQFRDTIGTIADGYAVEKCKLHPACQKAMYDKPISDG